MQLFLWLHVTKITFLCYYCMHVHVVLMVAQPTDFFTGNHPTQATFCSLLAIATIVSRPLKWPLRSLS